MRHRSHWFTVKAGVEQQIHTYLYPLRFFINSNQTSELASRIEVLMSRPVILPHDTAEMHCYRFRHFEQPADGNDEWFYQQSGETAPLRV